MVGKVETEQKRQAWQASLDQLHQTIQEIIQAQKNARYMPLSRLPEHYLNDINRKFQRISEVIYFTSLHFVSDKQVITRLPHY